MKTKNIKRIVNLINPSNYDHRLIFPSDCNYDLIIQNCNQCKKDSLCNNCDKLVNQNKEFSANLNELKREPPNNNGHMLPKYKAT